MAETKDSRGKDPVIRKREPHLSHDLDAAMEAPNVEAAPAGVRRMAAKHKKKGSWFQANRTVVIGVAAGAGVVAVALVLAFAFGWINLGGSAKPTEVAPSSVPTPSPFAATSASKAAQPSALPSSRPSPGQRAMQGPKKDEPPKPQKPPLPDNVKDWQGPDYFRARRENDPKLLLAIEDVGKRCIGSTPTARALTALLKPLPPEKPPAAAASPSVAGTSPAPGFTPRPGPAQRPGLTRSGSAPFGESRYNPGTMGVNPNVPGGQPYNQSDLTKLVETIIEALGCNGTDLARGTLEEVLAGTFSTDDDKAAVEATLKTLIAHSNEASDALLLRVLTAPADLRPASRQGAWPAKDLQAKAFELAKLSASSGLRTKLAGVLVADRAKIDPTDPVAEFLLASDPLNCAAQLLFYEKGNVNREIKTTLEQQMIGYSSTALARCLRVSDESQPSTGGYNMPMSRPGGGRFGMSAGRPGGDRFSMPASRPGVGSPVGPGEAVKIERVDMGPQLAGQLWSDGFLALLEPQLTGVRSLEKQPQAVVLAATIPLDSTRAILAKILRKRWNDGPKALETAGLTDRAITDPGFLAVVKMSGTRHESATTPRASDLTAPRTGRSPRPGPAYGGARLGDAAQKKLQAEQDWMDVSANLVLGWCKRFNAAASAKESGDEAGQTIGDAADLKQRSGFALADGARVVASRRVLLPGAAPADFAQVRSDTLEVYYVRAEETARPKKALRYYCQQAKSSLADARTIDRRVWFDSIRPGSQKDRRRSIDVLITRPEGGVAKADGADEEADLTIEVLIVEIKDPTKS